MNPVKLVRKFLKVLRGGATFRQVFLGFFLGIAVGMTPGINLTLLLCVAVLFLLNTNGGMAGIGIILGKLLCLLLAPVTFEMGYFLIHTVGLVGLIRAISDTPVLALLALDYYCLLGGIPFVLLIGGVGGWLLARWLVSLRASLARAGQKSEGLSKLSGNPVVKFVLRLAFGKQKETFDAMAEKKSPLLLKGRIIAGMVIVVIVAVLTLLFLDAAARAGIERGISSLTGAEVNVADAELSLSRGRLVIEGLQVTDAARPTHNRVQAERIETDVRISDLLAKRLTVELLLCQAMKQDAERSEPGEVYRKPDEKPQEPPPSDLGDRAAKIKAYYDQVKKLNDNMKKLEGYLKSEDPGREQAAAEKGDKPKSLRDQLKEEVKSNGYFAASAKKYLARHPTWVIREAKVTKYVVHSQLPTFTLAGEHLSSHPSLHGEPMKIHPPKPDKEAVKELVGKAGLDGIFPKESDKKKPSLLDKLNPFKKKEKKE